MHLIDVELKSPNPQTPFALETIRKPTINCS